MALYSAGDGGSESCVHRRRLGSHRMHRGRPGLCPPRAGGLQIRLGLGRPRALSSAVGLDRQAQRITWPVLPGDSRPRRSKGRNVSINQRCRAQPGDIGGDLGAGPGSSGPTQEALSHGPGSPQLPSTPPPSAGERERELGVAQTCASGTSHPASAAKRE